MRRQCKPRYTDGTAWLVVDRRDGGYFCSWYAAPAMVTCWSAPAS
jgi:hypothetical protein